MRAAVNVVTWSACVSDPWIEEPWAANRSWCHMERILYWGTLFWGSWSLPQKGARWGGGYACACSDCPAVSILNLNLGCSSDAASGYQSIATCWSSAMVRVRLKLALGPGQMSWGQSFCSRYVYAVGGHNVSYEHARERDDIVRQDTCGDRRLAQLRQHLVNSPLHHLTTSATKHHHQQQQRHH